MIIPLKLVRHDFRTHGLVRNTTPVGMIAPDVIRLWGFTDRGETERAAAIAGSLLDTWYSARGQQAEAHPAIAPGSHPVTVQGRDVGRVVAPGLLPDGTSLGSHAIEIAVPATMWLATKLHLAQQLHAAFLAEGVLEDETALAEAAP